MHAPPWPPVPPIQMPPPRTVRVADRGELFLRDTGGDGPPVMLLHGWMVSADVNWCGAYDDLARAGYRVLAIDHRGHGRGLRQLTPFRLVDCAGDAAAALRELGAAPAIVVGYSMGGAIAQLMARDYPDVVGGLVLSATAQHWQDPRTTRAFKAMGALGLLLSVAPRATWSSGLRRVGMPESPETAWALSEMIRHSARDIAEAGRELGRFDSRAWLRPLPMPSAVVLTTRDQAVAPARQRELAAALGAPVFEAPISHLQVTTSGPVYNPVLLRALAAVGGREAAAAASQERRRPNRQGQDGLPGPTDAELAESGPSTSRS
jgi:pimeloyl-ACP methyl ester carboxylesterase